MHSGLMTIFSYLNWGKGGYKIFFFKLKETEQKVFATNNYYSPYSLRQTFLRITLMIYIKKR